MLKKVATIAATGALLFSVAMPAFASVSIDNSGAEVDVTSFTVSNSGLNGVAVNREGSVEDVNVTSGNAVASSTVGTEVNNNTVNVTGWGCLSVDNSGAEVRVLPITVANSGVNGVVASEGGPVEDSNVTSGSATAGSNVQTLVNVNNVTVSNGEAL